MIKLSKLADYAVVVLQALRSGEDTVYNASRLSAATKLPEPTVSKILKKLKKAGILQSIQGPKGGYFISEGAGVITVLSVIEAIDGPVYVVDCIDEDAMDCSIQADCSVKGRWSTVNEAIRSSLESITIESLSCKPQQPVVTFRNMDMQSHKETSAQI